MGSPRVAIASNRVRYERSVGSSVRRRLAGLVDESLPTHDTFRDGECIYMCVIREVVLAVYLLFFTSRWYYSVWRQGLKSILNIDKNVENLFKKLKIISKSKMFFNGIQRFYCNSKKIIIDNLFKIIIVQYKSIRIDFQLNKLIKP